MLRDIPLRLAADDRILVTPNTRYRDYILTEYEPAAAPEGRCEPQALLRHVLRAEGWFDLAWPVCGRLRERLGPDETVWGFKWGGGDTAIEFYFYNFSQNGPDNPSSFTRVREALEGLVRFRPGVEVDESSPYFMWSFEIEPKGLAEGFVDDPRLYLGSGDTSRMTCGFSYHVGPEVIALENHYWFYAPSNEAQMADVHGRMRYSPRTGGEAAWPALLPDDLVDCHTICFAVKPKRDGLYFARVTTPQIMRFFEREHPSLAAMLQEHADDFAHLRWDLGYDFSGTPSAAAVPITKFALHGIL